MKRRAVPVEPRWLSGAALLAIHAQQIERYGGAHGVLDPAALGRIVAHPPELWAADPAADYADLAAAYLGGFTGERVFRDGNRRMGLACGLTFLSLNGLAVYVEPRQILALTLRLAEHEEPTKLAAAWLRA